MMLWPIGPDGACAGVSGPLPDDAAALMDATRQLYADQGHHPPWISYLACIDGEMVGGGAFVGRPTAEGAEIAYFTRTCRQGEGLAGRTAAALVTIARGAAPGLPIWAKTLPQENASTKVLKRLGFAHTGTAHDHEIGPAWRWELSPP